MNEKVEIHVYLHGLSEQRLSRIESLLMAVLRKENQIMATAQDVLKAAQDGATLEDSVLAAMEAFKQQLKDALAAAGANAASQQAIDDAFTTITANNAKFAAALGTTPTGEPVPPVTPLT